MLTKWDRFWLLLLLGLIVLPWWAAALVLVYVLLYDGIRCALVARAARRAAEPRVQKKIPRRQLWVVK